MRNESPTTSCPPKALLAAAAALAVSALACAPSPGGQCAADADCRAGTTCQRGLCRPEPTCATACEAGLHCASGSCAPDELPVLTWVTPEDGALRAGGILSLEVSVAQGAPAHGLSVIAVRDGASWAELPASVPLRRAGPGSWRGELDASALAEAAWTLVPFRALRRPRDRTFNAATEQRH